MVGLIFVMVGWQFWTSLRIEMVSTDLKSFFFFFLLLFLIIYLTVKELNNGEGAYVTVTDYYIFLMLRKVLKRPSLLLMLIGR